MQILTFLV